MWVSSNLIVATIAVDAQAAPGPRDVTVTNPGGDSGTRIGGFEVTDDQEPSVVFQTPTEGAEGSDTITVSVAATDDIGVEQVEFTIDDFKAPVATVAQFPFRFDWDTTEVADGAHVIHATATDTGGLQGTAEIPVTVNNLRVPGDCDGSGTVTIGEVQKAINMFLGIEPPACNVDCDGNGIVSIGEVQKVINAFLGISNSC